MIEIDNNGKPTRVSARLPKGSDWKSDLNMPRPNDDVEFVKPDPQNKGRDEFKSLKKAVEDYCDADDGSTKRRVGIPISDEAKEFTFAFKTPTGDWAELIGKDGLTMSFSEESIKPDYYQSETVECIECMEDCFGTEAVKAFCLCNAFKYLWRCKEKYETPIEDIKKAVWYLDKYLELCKYESV